MIYKKLKHGVFTFDLDNSEFTATAEKWNKVYGFALIRFVLRIVQSEILRKHEKISK